MPKFRYNQRNFLRKTGLLAMFENLSDRLSKTLRNITGKGRLTEDNIKETLREVRMALLEADVALPVVREFIAKVKESALGEGFFNIIFR